MSQTNTLVFMESMITVHISQTCQYMVLSLPGYNYESRSVFIVLPALYLLS